MYDHATVGGNMSADPMALEANLQPTRDRQCTPSLMSCPNMWLGRGILGHPRSRLMMGRLSLMMGLYRGWTMLVLFQLFPCNNWRILVSLLPPRVTLTLEIRQLMAAALMLILKKLLMTSKPWFANHCQCPLLEPSRHAGVQRS
jgi:hypothetical protein